MALPPPYRGALVNPCFARPQSPHPASFSDSFERHYEMNHLKIYLVLIQPETPRIFSFRRLQNQHLKSDPYEAHLHGAAPCSSISSPLHSSCAMPDGPECALKSTLPNGIGKLPANNRRHQRPEHRIRDQAVKRAPYRSTNALFGLLAADRTKTEYPRGPPLLSRIRDSQAVNPPNPWITP
jgi:hypothetical protein